MTISIITVTYNSALTISDTIISVLNQDYEDIEYIVIDGGSTDGTLEIVNKYDNGVFKIISEPDKGIYDAMNKGIKIATGDIIGILNSDDFFSSNNVISKIVNIFKNNINLDAVYGDVHFVNSDNLNKVTRYYSSRVFKPSLLKFGFMPAHPSLYVTKGIYNRFGFYKTDYKIASDFEMIARLFYKNSIKTKYLPIDIVTMRTGGVSTKNIKSKIILNKETLRACKENGIKTNLLMILSKYFYKVFELKI